MVSVAIKDNPESTIFKFHSTTKLMWLPVIWSLPFGVPQKVAQRKEHDKHELKNKNKTVLQFASSQNKTSTSSIL